MDIGKLVEKDGVFHEQTVVPFNFDPKTGIDFPGFFKYKKTGITFEKDQLEYIHSGTVGANEDINFDPDKAAIDQAMELGASHYEFLNPIYPSLLGASIVLTTNYYKAK